jgi:hypothetical protein
MKANVAQINAFTSLLAYQDGFGQKQEIVIPNIPNTFIRIGGTASCGTLQQSVSQIVQLGYNTLKVLSKDGVIYEYPHVGKVKLFGMVYIFEHMIVVGPFKGQFRPLASSLVPLNPLWHAINIDYVQDGEILHRSVIDPYTQQYDECELLSKGLI